MDGIRRGGKPTEVFPDAVAHTEGWGPLGFAAAEAEGADFEGAEGFLERFLEGAADGHGFADAFSSGW